MKRKRSLRRGISSEVADRNTRRRISSVNSAECQYAGDVIGIPVP
jgi:hypothetical protein